MTTDCEIPEFYSVKEQWAQKPHFCCECKAHIKKGETYLMVKGKWNGEFSSYRQHLLCAEACEYIRDYLNDYECIGFGDLFEWFNEADKLRHYKTNPAAKKFRDMMAKIIKRFRNDFDQPHD